MTRPALRRKLSRDHHRRTSLKHEVGVACPSKFHLPVSYHTPSDQWTFHGRRLRQWNPCKSRKTFQICYHSSTKEGTTCSCHCTMATLGWRFHQLGHQWSGKSNGTLKKGFKMNVSILQNRTTVCNLWEYNMMIFFQINFELSYGLFFFNLMMSFTRHRNQCALHMLQGNELKTEGWRMDAVSVFSCLKLPTGISTGTVPGTR